MVGDEWGMEYAGEGRSGGRGVGSTEGNGDPGGNGGVRDTGGTGRGKDPERAVRVGSGVTDCCGEEGTGGKGEI